MMNDRFTLRPIFEHCNEDLRVRVGLFFINIIIPPNMQEHQLRE
jgi:hypothetical protein